MNTQRQNMMFVTLMLISCIGLVGLSASLIIDRLQAQNEQLYNSLSAFRTDYQKYKVTSESQLTDLAEDVDELTERLDEAELQIRLNRGKIVLMQSKLNKITPTPTPKPKITSNATSTYRNKVSVRLSNYDIRNIAALVYLEAGGQSYRCQKAIASVIINRMSRYHKTASQVICEPGVFGPASQVRSTKPNAQCLRAVRDVVNHGTTLPKSVVAFRNKHYHSFGRRYCCIDGVYFTAM